MENGNIKARIIKTTNFDILERIEKNMSDIICIHSPDGRYIYVTPSVKVILGYFPEELIGTSPYEYFHPDDMEKIRRESHAWALEGETAETRIEYRYRNKDDSYIWMQTQTTPIFDLDGSVTELVTVSRDISDYKQAEEATQEIEASYQQLFQNSPVIRFIIDPVTGNIVDANQAAVDFYGYTLKELQTITIFKINVTVPEEIREYMSKVSKDYCKSIPFRHKLKDGSLREVEVYSGPVRIWGKTLLYSIIIDVSAQKRLEEELRESRERLSLVVQGTKAGI